MIRLGADESHRRPPVFAASSAELCKTCNDCFVDEEVRRRDYGRESEAAAGDRGGRTVGGPLPSGWTPTRSLRTVSTIDRAENEPLSRSERWGSPRLHRSATGEDALRTRKEVAGTKGELSPRAGCPATASREGMRKAGIKPSRGVRA